MYSGKSKIPNGKPRIDHEYYGNGNGNVHISSPNGGKFYIWELNDGLEIWYNVPSHIIKLMPERDFARAVQRQIETVVGLAGFGKGR